VRVCLVSLGCPKNRVDGETMLGLLGSAGHDIAATPELADVVLVNTCGFIQSAQQESVGVLLDMARRKRRGRPRYLIATGCLAQAHAAELLAEIPELDAAAGTAAAADIVQLVSSLGPAGGPRPALVGAPGYLPAGVDPRLVSTPPWTAYLKISEGCDNRCSYCAIPDLRGTHRSRPPEDIATEARQLVDAGVREIILVGQDLTRWGQERGLGLPDLLQRLVGIDGLHWLRLHYLHPARVDERLLAMIASEPKICRYLDVPIQHGDDAILAGMGRGVTAGQLIGLVARARQVIPGVAVRTTVITGFPGETKHRFRRLLQLLHALAPDWTGAFAYSPQAGTPAAELPGRVPGRTRARRRALVMALARRLSARHNRELIGRPIEVLIESTPAEIDWPDGTSHLAVTGRTYRDAPEIDGSIHIAVDADDVPQPGEFRLALVTSAGPYDLYGSLLPQR